MNQILQHVPDFVDGSTERNAVHVFDTVEDLMALPLVRRFTLDPTFSHLALSENRLLAIYNDGFEWWVIGVVTNPTELDLPAWDGGKYRARLADGTETVLTRADVDWTCGGKITLRDGTIAQDLRR